MTNIPSSFSQTDANSEEEIQRLVRNYNLDLDTATRVQDIMRFKGVDEDSAIELVKEEDNGM